ncbi:MAG: HAD family hydrolase [Candidatus Zixiibacteriota bacterium]
MKTRVISVDLWGTVFDFNTEISVSARRRQLISEYAEKLGFADKSALDSAYLDTSLHFGNTYREKARLMTPKERLEHQLNLVGLSPNGNGFDDLVCNVQNALFEIPPPLAPNVKDGLNALAQEFTLVIVSDTGFSPGAVIRKIFDRYQITEYFSDYSFSDETGTAKPDSVAFTSVLDRVKCDPAESLHIGDTEWTDIKGASALGAKTCLYVGLNDEYLDGTKADHILRDWNDAPQLVKLIKAS